jgi:DNA-binding transcriptional MerR regulator
MSLHIQERLDKEWISLIVTAKKMGFSIEEIQSFLKQESDKQGN